MSKGNEPKHDLDAYLIKKGIEAKVIAVKTGILEGDLSKLRNQNTKLSAVRLFMIGSFYKDPIGHAINSVYPNLSLPDKPVKVFVEEETDLGTNLFPKGKQYMSVKEIAYRTDISVERLRDLLTKKTAVLLAYELILIEQATGRKPGELFTHLFKNEKLASSTVKKV